jgi:hypothetical protein
LDTAQLYQLRQENAKPILDEFKDWLETKGPLTPPKGLLGQAIGYTLANWKKLIIYIEDGRLKPDNNLVENAIRPFVVGRNYADLTIMRSSPTALSVAIYKFYVILRSYIVSMECCWRFLLHIITTSQGRRAHLAMV